MFSTVSNRAGQSKKKSKTSAEKYPWISMETQQSHFLSMYSLYRRLI